MARCGWCKLPGIAYSPDGMLQAHNLPGTRKRCRGYDNPSIQLIKQTNDTTKKYDPDWEHRSAQRMRTKIADGITRSMKEKAVRIRRLKDKGFSGEFGR